LHRSLEADPGAGTWLSVDASDGMQALEVIRRAIRSV